MTEKDTAKRGTDTALREPVTLNLEAAKEPAAQPLATSEPKPTARKSRAAAAAAATAQPAGPMAQILELKRLGITQEDIREYLALQHEHEAREAKQQYNRAMAQWKADGVPEIPKAVHVRFKNSAGKITDYWHEDLADVVNIVLPLMARAGLSHSWTPSQEGRGDNMLITVRTVVTHVAGHSEGVSLYAAPDNSGGKNSIQGVKSTISYLERIGLLAILGLAAKGHDNDGRGVVPVGELTEDEMPPSSAGSRPDPFDEQAQRGGGKPRTSPPQTTVEARGGAGGGVNVVTEKQVGLLKVRLREVDVGEHEFCAVYGVPSVEDLPRDRMDEALKWIGQQRR